jgi:hypothetical protein
VTLTATNGTLPNATQNFTVLVNASPAITSASTAMFLLNAAGTFQVTTTGFPAPTISVTAGVLPTGLTLSPGGLLSGTPTQFGSFPVTLTATNGLAPDATQNFTVLVTTPPAITSANTATFALNTPGTTFQVLMTGFPPPTVSVTAGVLPNGLTLSPAGLLSGTPTQGGSFPVTLTATNGTLPNATQNFTVIVSQPPTFTSANAATFVVGQAGTFTITTNAVPNAAFPAIGVGPLPSGVTFTDNGNGTATLSGTPAIDTNGTYALTITADNGIGGPVTQSFTLTVDNPSQPIITSSASATFHVGALESFTVTTAAFLAATAITETGALAAGLTFVNNNDGTATLSGRPNAGTAGVYPLTIAASNGGAPTPQTFTLTVVPAAGAAPTITSANTTTFAVGALSTFTITTTGTPAASINPVVPLPVGVNFVDNGDGTATISGTPLVGTGSPLVSTAGLYPVTITATNGVGTATQNFTLAVMNNVTGTPLFTSAPSAAFTIGLGGTFTVRTAATPAVGTIAQVGVPAGVTFTDNGDGTATLSLTGSPVANLYAITFTAGATTQKFTLKVLQAPSITSATSTTFAVGVAATPFTVTTAGVPSPALSQTLALPSGVNFIDNGDGTATLSGTPAAGTGGAHTLSFTAINGVGTAATQSFTLNINDAGRFTSANSTTFTVGSNGNFLVTTQAFPSTGTITRTGAALPTGVNFDDHGDGTATLSGTPAAGTGGTYNFTFTFNNGVGGPVTQNFTLTVQQPPLFTSANSTTFTVGTAATPFTVTASGFPAPTITQTGGALPTGATFTSATGVLAGTPTQIGAFPLTFTAANGVVPDATQNFTLTVACPAITVNPSTLADGLFNTAYGPVTFTQTGSTGSSFTWSQAGLPTGIGINPLTGVVSGTPTNTVLNGVVGITVTDNFGCTGTRTTTISVRPVAGGDTFGNAVGNTQLAVGAVGALPSTPTAVISGNVKTNDDGVGAPGALSVVFAATSANSGTIVEGAADGSFLYTPAPNFAGASDTFTYTLTDGNGVTNTGTVTINFLNRVWYVNSAVAGPGDGRSNNPFNTLDKAAAPSLAGDIVYVHTGSGATSGALAMDANSTLQGAGGAVSLNGGVLVIAAGTAPTLSGTVTIANNTAIRNVNFSGASPAMTASGLATTVPSVIDNVSVTGGTNALSLTNVTATGTGAINVTNSTFTNTSGAEVLVNGGNVPLSIGATLSSNAGRVIDIQNRTGGAVTFSGSVTDSGTGIFLNNNAGGSFTFSGGVTLNGASSTFASTNSAVTPPTLTITGTNTIGATTPPAGPALNVSNTTIGASGLTFLSIAATGGANGIVLNNTGATAGLTVTGGGNTTLGGDNSGGTIQNTTGFGISLTTTFSPSFTNVRVLNTAGHGVGGTDVTNFTFKNGRIDGSNADALTTTEEANIGFYVNETNSTRNNLDGVVVITGNVLTNAQFHGIDIFNFSGTITSATISNNTITSSTSTAASQGGGIRLIAFGSATTIANVTLANITNNVISNFPSGWGIQAQGGNGNLSGPAGVFGTAGDATNKISITGNQLTGGPKFGTFAIVTNVNGRGQGNFDISNNGTVANPITNSLGNAISVGSFGFANVTATVNNNVIVANNTVGAAGIGAGTSQTVSSAETPSLTVTITNNTVSQTDGNGILVTARDATGTVRAKIQNNTVAAPLSGNRNGIRVDAGNGISVNDSVCLNISGNTTAGVNLSPEGIGLRKQGTVAGTNNMAFNGFATSPATQAQTVAFVGGLNPGSAVNSGTGDRVLIISGDNFNFPICSLP